MNMTKVMHATKALKAMYYAVLITALSATFVSAQSFSQASSGICNIVNAVRGVIGVVSLLLFIIGGTLYAIAHFMPASGNMRGNLQGWSIGMVIGGMVGLILVLIAPSLLNLIISSGGSGIGSANC
jgi:hypothetical protein